MKDQRLKQALQEVVEYKAPNTIDIWPALHDKLNPQTPTSSSRPDWTTNRLSWAIMTLCAILLFASAVYALNPLIRNLLRMDPALDQVNSSELGYPINLTQTQDDVVVTLDWAYADENRIAIAFTFSGDEANQYQPVDLILSDDGGTKFSPFAGMGSTDSSELGGASNQGGYIFSFDTPPVSDQLEKLDLQLEIVLESTQDKRQLSPLAFDFSVPFTPSRVAEPDQSVTVENITIRLEKVIVTPAEIKTTVCFDDPRPGYTNWTLLSNINVQSEDTTASAIAGQMHQDKVGCISSRYFPSLYEENGSWSLTVTELIGRRENKPMDESAPGVVACSGNKNEDSEYCFEQLRIRGPWVFEFDLP